MLAEDQKMGGPGSMGAKTCFLGMVRSTLKLNASSLGNLGPASDLCWPRITNWAREICGNGGFCFSNKLSVWEAHANFRYVPRDNEESRFTWYNYLLDP